MPKRLLKNQDNMEAIIPSGQRKWFEKGTRALDKPTESEKKCDTA